MLNTAKGVRSPLSDWQGLYISDEFPQSCYVLGSLVVSVVKNPPANAGDSVGWEDLLEEGTATHASILAWKIASTEEPRGLQSMGSQKDRHD